MTKDARGERPVVSSSCQPTTVAAATPCKKTLRHGGKHSFHNYSIRGAGVFDSWSWVEGCSGVGRVGTVNPWHPQPVTALSGSRKRPLDTKMQTLAAGGRQERLAPSKEGGKGMDYVCYTHFLKESQLMNLFRNF